MPETADEFLNGGGLSVLTLGFKIDGMTQWVLSLKNLEIAGDQATSSRFVALRGTALRMGKWLFLIRNKQAGRFYVKAIESYEAALQRNPNSFDAAYNRCANSVYCTRVFVLISTVLAFSIN